MYVIYTSGSTGRPKGIVQTFRTIRNLVRWQNEESGIQFTGRVLQNSSLAFDVAFQEILSALTAGGTLVVSSQRERLEAEAMIELLTRAAGERDLPFRLHADQAVRHSGTACRAARLADRHITAGEQLHVADTAA